MIGNQETISIKNTNAGNLNINVGNVVINGSNPFNSSNENVLVITTNNKNKLDIAKGAQELRKFSIMDIAGGPINFGLDQSRLQGTIFKRNIFRN
jgi:hypothetical protein